jgi:hypothetical protein
VLAQPLAHLLFGRLTPQLAAQTLAHILPLAERGVFE